MVEKTEVIPWSRLKYVAEKLDKVVVLAREMVQAGKSLEGRVASLESGKGNLSLDEERDILYGMFEDHGKEVNGLAQQVHGLRIQFQKLEEKIGGNLACSS